MYKMTEVYTEEFIKLERTIGDFLRKIRTRHIKDSHELGLSVPQFTCIWIISKMGRVKMSEVADVLALSYASATNLINKLSDSGFTERYDDPKDRRIVYVELTEKGKNLTDQIRNKHIVSFNKWYSKASEKEKEYILNGLNCVIDALISD